MMTKTTLCSPVLAVTASQISPKESLPAKLPRPMLENSQLAAPGAMPLLMACSCSQYLCRRCPILSYVHVQGQIDYFVLTEVKLNMV